MSFWRRPFSQRQDADGDGDVYQDDQSSGQEQVTDGSLHYVFEKAGNDSGPTYQEASGAPVEVESPLGYDVGAVTIICLNVSNMIGTGVYSTTSSILNGTGSVGLSMIYWALGFLTSITSFAVYLEFASYFSNRSGSEVVYLEQSFPKPRWLFPTTFAFQSVVLSFSSGNAIVLAQYLFATAGRDYTDWQLKGVAIAGYTAAFLLVVAHTKFSYFVSNAIGVVKILTLVFVGLTGLVVLGGHTRVPDPLANFENAFSHGDGVSAYGLTNALYKIIFSYAGFTNAFNVVNEVKDPIKQIKRNGTISILIVTVLYILANIAYFAAVPKEDIAAAKQIAASLFFENVFGAKVKGLNILVALSSFGNLIAVLLGSSRALRECGRQGVLPFPRFWASTKPFGTPAGPYLVKWALTVIMILAPPAGDAFSFITDLSIYPGSFFAFLLSVGLFLVRHRRGKLGLPRPAFRAWDATVVFTIVVQLFLLIMPWYPPEGGIYSGDVSFFYATYVITGIGIIIGCGVYYWMWVWVVPKFRGYRVRQEVLVLDDGAQSHQLVKVPVAALPEWDATHDAVGRRLHVDGAAGSVGTLGSQVDGHERHVAGIPEKSAV